MRKLFGTRNRRRAPEKPTITISSGRVLRVLAGVLAVAGAVVTGPQVATNVREHPYFAVREVVVRGQRRLSADRVRALAGIETGMSVWAVDGDAAEARLRAEPWLRSAVVRRDIPHRVVIQVREQRPVAILAPEDRKQAYYVAGHGSIFATVAPGDPTDFPYLSGLRAADIEAGDAFGLRAIRRALGLLRVATRSPGVGTISEVLVDRTRGLTLLPVRPAVPIEFGWGAFAGKLARLGPALAQWAGRESELAGVCLLFDDEVVVRTRSPRRPVPDRKLRT